VRVRVEHFQRRRRPPQIPNLYAKIVTRAREVPRAIRIVRERAHGARAGRDGVVDGARALAAAQVPAEHGAADGDRRLACVVRVPRDGADKGGVAVKARRAQRANGAAVTHGPRVDGCARGREERLRRMPARRRRPCDAQGRVGRARGRAARARAERHIGGGRELVRGRLRRAAAAVGGRVRVGAVIRAHGQVREAPHARARAAPVERVRHCDDERRVRGRRREVEELKRRRPHSRAVHLVLFFAVAQEAELERGGGGWGTR